MYEKNTHMLGVHKRGGVREIPIEQLGRPSKDAECNAHKHGGEHGDRPRAVLTPTLHHLCTGER